MSTEAEETDIVIDQERPIFGQQDSDPGVIATALRTDGTVGQPKVTIIITPHFVAKRLFFNPVVDGLEVTLSNADDFYAEGIELGFEVTEPATFDGSPIGPRGWKEPQDRRASRNVGRTSWTSVGVGSHKVHQCRTYAW